MRQVKVGNAHIWQHIMLDTPNGFGSNINQHIVAQKPQCFFIKLLIFLFLFEAWEWAKQQQQTLMYSVIENGDWEWSQVVWGQQCHEAVEVWRHHSIMFAACDSHLQFISRTSEEQNKSTSVQQTPCGWTCNTGCLNSSQADMLAAV